MLRIFLLVLLLFCVGCDSNTTAPTRSDAQPTALDENGEPWTPFQWRSFVVYYTSCGTYIGSYSNDFVGPMQDGYCRENGTGIPSDCRVGDISWASVLIDVRDSRVIKIVNLSGDPTSDD